MARYSTLHIAAELGPNPAPIVELVWALYRQRGLRTAKLHLLTNQQGHAFVHELYRGLRMLEEVVGWCPEIADLTLVTSEDGTPVDTDLTSEDNAAWMKARWKTYRAAFGQAKESPVVFAIAANRDRSILTTGMYTLLARPQDLCLEVRVSEPRVLGAT